MLSPVQNPSFEQHRIASDRDLNIALSDLRRRCGIADFKPSDVTRILTAASELGRNILKYAESGELQFRSAFKHSVSGIEVVAIDQGPGIPDLERALEDKYSTGDTLGLGLPGVKRLVDEFAIQSSTTEGTRVSFCIWRR